MKVTSSAAPTSPLRGNHVLKAPVDLCAIKAIAPYVASVYQVTNAPVGCAPDSVHVAGETPPIAAENWYFPTIPNSGNVGTGAGRVAITVLNDHTQYTPHFWTDQLRFLQTQPQAVRSAGLVNGIPALWENGGLTTPYGANEDLQVVVFADLDGRPLPNVEDVAKKLATIVEAGAFR
jgi:hypothetical protein